jgi:hypothetical protein
MNSLLPGNAITPDHFAPFGDFISDKLIEIGRRTTQRRATYIGEPLPHLRIGEHGVDLMVERIDNRFWCFLWRTNSVPNECFEPSHKFCHGWNIRQSV